MTSLQLRSTAVSSTTDLRIEDVSVVFNLQGRDLVALESLTLEIPTGQTLALVGPSGCGKTTLLNVIAGFIQPTTGRVLVGGEPVRGPSSQRSVVFQADAVFPWLSVRENLKYGPRIRREFDDAARERVERYLEMMGLTAFAGEYPKVLSGGMRKRVDVARVYVSDPSVVLLDEPFGALDDFTKSNLQDELVKLKKIDPKTTVFVTHDIEEAIYVGDVVAVMAARPGRLQEVIEVPLSPDREAAVKDSDEFQELRQHIQRLLRRTMADAAEEAA